MRCKYFILFSLHLLIYNVAIAQTSIFDKKIDSLNNELELSSEIHIKGRLYSQIADLHSKKEEYLKAKKANFKALDIFQSIGNNKNSCKVLLDLAMNYDKSNQFDEAIKYSYEALEVLELLEKEIPIEDYDFRKGMILMNIGIILGQTDNSTESLKTLKEASSLLINAKPFYQAVCHENLGIAHSKLSNNEEALHFYNKALDFYISNEVEPMLISNTLINIGNIYIETKEAKKALKMYKNALNHIDNKEIYVNEKTSVLNNIGNAYIELDSLKNAKYYLDMSKNISNGVGGKRFINDNYRFRVKLYEKQKDFENAFNNIKILNAIEDSLYEPELLEKIATIKNDYDLKVEQRENLLKIQLLEREKEISNYNIYALIGFIMFIVIIGVLLYNRQQQKSEINKVALKNIELEKQQLSDKLKFKNNQLTNYAVYIIKKNDFLVNIKSEVDKLKSEGENRINSLSNIINQHISSSKDQKEFEIRVKKENQDFYYKLENKFPGLSEKNKNLCSLLLLDLTSKEISSLQNISVESVEKSRYRLRKKFEIPKEISISSYLKQL